MKRFYVQVSAPGSNLPDVQFWSVEGALRERVYQFRFPEAWSAEEREVELARLRAAAEGLSGDIPKDFLFFLLEDMVALEAEQLQVREAEIRELEERNAREAEEQTARDAAKRLERRPRDFGSDFGNLCVGERVGSFSPRREDRIDGMN